MTPRAQVEPIEPDAWLAREFLDQARTFLHDGRVEELSGPGRQVLLHHAAVAACDAVLAINGLEVKGSEGGHVLRLDEAQRCLGSGYGDLFERLDDARDRRVVASYRAGAIDAEGVDVAVESVGELVRLAGELIEPQLPGWVADS